jgi:tRNA pseudouridine55 synthase
MTWEGILPVLKPAGFTSHDVVAKTRRLLKIKRIGHTGTLDPMVTGVLPLCIGRATRVVEYIQELPKEYEAVMRFGIATDTEDLTGTVLEQWDRVTLTEAQIRAAVISFVGEIEQVPPMYSAVKVNGQRLYELARLGQEIERKPRKAVIHSIDILSMDVDKPHPEIRFKVRCSKGTYIRTLCTDIGKKLEVPAVMAELVRTATGSITLDRCITLEQIEQLVLDGGISAALIPADEAISHIPEIIVDAQDAVKALRGQKVTLADGMMEDAIYRVYSPDRQFLGLFRWETSLRRLVPEKVFN